MESAPASVARESAGHRDSRRRWLLLAALMSALPVLRMAWWIHDGSILQYSDYWPIAEATFRFDGGLSLGALVHRQGAHLLSVPQVIYWTNMRLFGGSNLTLGAFVMVIALGQLALLWSWVARTGGLPSAVKAALAVAAATLVFAPHGAWNFLLAMSGTAWVVANLLVVAAITFLHRGRTAVAIVLALLATVTYGTGLLAWPVLVLVAAWGQPTLRRALRGALPVVVVAAPTMIAYLLLRSRDPRPTLPRPGPLALAHNTATVAGGVVSDPGPASWAGAMGIGLVVILGIVAARTRRAGVAPWVGLATFSLLAAGLIGYTRHIAGSDDAHLLASRYGSITSQLWLSVLALAASVASPLLAHRRRVVSGLLVAGLIGVVALLVSLTGVREVRSVRDQDRRQQQLADALRVGVAEGGIWLVFEPFPDLTPLLSALGHYPFDSRYEGACDLLGTTLDPAAVESLTGEGQAGPTTARRDPNMTSAMILSSWVDPAQQVDCVAITNGSGEVIGVGRDGYDVLGRAQANGLWGIAPTGADSYRFVVRFDGSETLYGLRPRSPPRNGG